MRSSAPLSARLSPSQPRDLSSFLPTDYGESHYVGPVKGSQPNSQAWVDGFAHTPWLELSAYFARAFKDGVYPPIDRDRIFMWARPHLRDAEATDDAVPRPDRWQLVSMCAAHW